MNQVQMTEYRRKVSSGKKVSKGMWLACVRTLHKTIVWRGKERYRIRDVQMDNLRSLGMAVWRKVCIRGLMKVLKEWGIIGLLKGYLRRVCR